MDLQSSDDCLEVETREDVTIARFTRKMSLCGEVAEDVAEQLVSVLSEMGQQRLPMAAHLDFVAQIDGTGANDRWIPHELRITVKEIDRGIQTPRLLSLKSRQQRRIRIH